MYNLDVNILKRTSKLKTFNDNKPLLVQSKKNNLETGNSLFLPLNTGKLFVSLNTHAHCCTACKNHVNSEYVVRNDVYPVELRLVAIQEHNSR